VLDKPWPGAELTKAPKESRLPDIVTVEQVQRIVDATRALSYRVFIFILYSMGLRLSKGLHLVPYSNNWMHRRQKSATIKQPWY